MGTKKHRTGLHLILAVGMVCMVLTIVVLPAWVRAAPSDLPPRFPTSTPTPQPTVRPKPKPKRDTEPRGAHIELYVQFPDSESASHWQGLWTVVQWQDAQGKWHDVEGWRGELDGMQGGVGRKVWWLADNLFGRGPFRWLVHQAGRDELPVTSQPFNLPRSAGETVQVEVLLVP